MQQQQAAYEQRIIQAYAAQTAPYMADPTFRHAYSTLAAQRAAEYKAAGFSDVEATQFSHRYEFALAVRALQNGINPAEQLMGLAQARGISAMPSADSDDGSDDGNDGKLSLEDIAEFPPERWDELLKASTGKDARPQDYPDDDTPMSAEDMGNLSDSDVASLVDELWPSDSGGTMISETASEAVLDGYDTGTD